MAANLRQRIGELIGGSGRIRLRQINGYAPTTDYSTADYRYWDRARRAKARGLEISGLLLKPLGSKVAAWVLGDTPEWNTNDGQATLELNAWWQAHHAEILRGYEEALNLGDCYLVINGDMSVTVVPPHVVEPLLDGEGVVMGWRISETFDGGTRIIDEYTATTRVRRIERGGVVVQTTRYDNPIGRLPVIHIANRYGADEFYGRPEGDALIPALQRYGDVIDAAIKGNVRQGRPTPVIEKMGTAEQVRKFWEKFGRRETQRLPDGSSETTDVIDFDPDQLLTLGGEAQFKYAAPGSFSGDTQALLSILFYLVLQHSEIPEVVWGAAIPGSRASADTQMEPFVRWIGKKRGLAEAWMLETARVVLGYAALIDFRINLETALEIVWPTLTEEDGRLRLDTVEWAHGAGILDDEGTRRELGI